ncbi:ketopantoate reductase family protein [Polyangium sorediatum]|uniref:2-dehydropantoate 2-reductase N-terminal domain-containing protein n=1 Tax=Polyangium sorediatum TaxID=889274 RepID=A0ABT6PAQ8_9BACT|nr:2-dehydropantoate 2-reductase N-terminal domain-containing protein [Polyangium sorediatum]MDI1437342.1 2-dehydropantoate 2-reductase N-terminal domain-containing protein [Polyangium sorediatum]
MDPARGTPHGMQIAIIGPGGIGSTFAFQLARAGHAVTVVARGKRLEQLQRELAIVTASGERAAVGVSTALDPTIAWDLVLVTVLAPQVDGVLPALAASAARTIMFMFNTFEPLDRLRDAVGASRFAFGFPAILAVIADGVLTTEIVRRPMSTTVTDAAWAEVFSAAGIPSVVHPDMESWLRTHAAMVMPMMIAIAQAHTRGAGVSWREAQTLARAMDEGLRLVRRLGNSITPAPMEVMSRLPVPVLASFIWTACRVPAIRKSGAAGLVEPRALLDAMITAAPGPTPALAALRPLVA